MDRSREEKDALQTAHRYHATAHFSRRKLAGGRAYSESIREQRREHPAAPCSRPAIRKLSEETYLGHSRNLLLPVESTLRILLENEDTNMNMQITIEDNGPKILAVGTEASNGCNRMTICGTYMLSNLLQELSLAKDFGRNSLIVNEVRLRENPVKRLSRLISDTFWEGLTRRIDGSNIAKVGRDPKDWTGNPKPRIYIPRGAPEQYAYFTRIAKEQPEIHLDVQWLPLECTRPEYVRDLNEAPGLLAVAMEQYVKDPATGETDLRGLPFIVPGGRFNELYNWDSYMISLGLLASGRVDLVKATVEHFCFCVRHYEKMLNANRSYYLSRSQPPFLTDMAFRVYESTRGQPGSLDFLKTAIMAAIREYYGVWMSPPRYDPDTGLSRYRPEGIGIPPETEPSHYDIMLRPYARKHNMTIPEFVKAYNYGKVKEPDLDIYLLHDRGARESGHDTSYRLDGVCADLATVDLNSLLYKYEVDIARAIRYLFDDKLTIAAEYCAKGKQAGYVETSPIWEKRTRCRKGRMNQYLWNAEEGMYFDYNTAKREQTTYECATTFWPLWAGAASPDQAAKVVGQALPKFEAFGGLVASTERSRGPIGPDRPARQWDYPFGWAPHQMLAWTGLLRYRYEAEAQRLAYKWLYIVTKTFSDYNGIVVEKYDVVSRSANHKVDAEYGNQGSDVRGAPREGFGWVNASFVCGLEIVTAHMERALGACAPWEVFEKASKDSCAID